MIIHAQLYMYMHCHIPFDTDLYFIKSTFANNTQSEHEGNKETLSHVHVHVVR